MNLKNLTDFGESGLARLDFGESSPLLERTFRSSHLTLMLFNSKISGYENDSPRRSACRRSSLSKDRSSVIQSGILKIRCQSQFRIQLYLTT